MDRRLNKMKEFFSFEEVNRLYNQDYIEINLKNIILSKTFEVNFLPIKDLYIHTEVLECGWNWYNDPWLKKTSNDKLFLGRNIVERGTYYPIVVSPINGSSKLNVMEGSHRVLSLKMLSMMNEIEDDFKVFCLVSPTDFVAYKQFCKEYNTFIIYRDILIRQDNFESILGNQNIINDIFYEIKQSGDRIINNYVKETHTTNCFDVLHAMTRYSGVFRDLFYIYNDIKPHKIINSEQEYKKWINK